MGMALRPAPIRCLAGLAAAAGVGSLFAGCGTPRSASAATSPSGAPASEITDLSPTPLDSSGEDAAAQALIWNVARNKPASVSSGLNSARDINYFDIGPILAGDLLRVEVVGEDGFDAAVAVLDADRNVLYVNDDRSFYGGLVDPAADVFVYADSPNCYIAVAASPKSAGAGDYTLHITLNEGQAVLEPRPQIVYLNFDGASDVRIGSRAAVEIPPFAGSRISPDFAQYTEQIIDLAVDGIYDDFDGLNVELLSSRDYYPPDEPHTTIHFGAYDEALLGVADNVDEYNLFPTQEAVVFIDTFAAFNRVNPNVEEIAQAIANVASHEIGHLLGLYHTIDPHGVMDVTASLQQMLRDQTFNRSRVHGEVFPTGHQDAPTVLENNVGGWLLTAGKAIDEASNNLKAQEGEDLFDTNAKPARSELIFGTCAQCNTERLHRR